MGLNYLVIDCSRVPAREIHALYLDAKAIKRSLLSHNCVQASGPKKLRNLREVGWRERNGLQSFLQDSKGGNTIIIFDPNVRHIAQTFSSKIGNLVVEG